MRQKSEGEVARGGSYWSTREPFCCATRYWYGPTHAANFHGFRIATRRRKQLRTFRGGSITTYPYLYMHCINRSYAGSLDSLYDSLGFRIARRRP